MSESGFALARYSDNYIVTASVTQDQVLTSLINTTCIPAASISAVYSGNDYDADRQIYSIAVDQNTIYVPDGGGNITAIAVPEHIIFHDKVIQFKITNRMKSMSQA